MRAPRPFGPHAVRPSRPACLAAALAALLLGPAAARAQRGMLDTAAVRVQLDSARQALAAAHQARDSAALARAFAPRPVLAAPGQVPFAPAQAVALYVAGWLRTSLTDAAITPSAVRVASDSSASEEGTWEAGGLLQYTLRWQRGPDRRWRVAELRLTPP